MYTRSTPPLTPHQYPSRLETKSKNKPYPPTYTSAKREANSGVSAILTSVPQECGYAVRNLDLGIFYTWGHENRFLRRKNLKK